MTDTNTNAVFIACRKLQSISKVWIKNLYAPNNSFAQFSITQ